MPRKKLTQEEKEQLQKENRLKNEYNDLIKNLYLIPEPTYFFSVGEVVHLGRLINTTITEVLEDGKIYKIRYSVEHNNYGHPYVEEGLERYVAWYDLRPMPKDEESLIQNEDIYMQFSPMSIGSLFAMAYHFGTDMNPDYQRDYVWSEEDKVALIDSIFNNIDIGKFCFVHRGYSDAYMYEIIDGKQRMRAILDFYENRFKYKGKYFNDLCAKDRCWFENFSIAIAEVREADKKSILKYFLMLNKGGKQMDKAHIESIEKMYNNI